MLSLTSTIEENFFESFGSIKLGQTSIKSLFSHSQGSNGVMGCGMIYKDIDHIAKKKTTKKIKTKRIQMCSIQAAAIFYLNLLQVSGVETSRTARPKKKECQVRAW